MATRSKGDGSIYQTADGKWRGSIEAGWTPTGRKRRTVSGPTRAAVVRKMRELRKELEAGVGSDDPTVDEWLTHWLDVICPARGLKPSTLQGYRSHITNHITPNLGKRRLKALKPEHVRALHRAMLDAGLSPTTVRQVHAILSRALKVAEREGKVMRNVATLVDVPSPAVNPHPALTVAQAKKVLQANADNPRVLARLTVALILGLRQGEALGLRWEDVDLDAGLIDVHDGLTIITGEGPRLTGVKSQASNRAVPIPAPVVAILRAWQAHAVDQWVFPSLRYGSGLEREPRLDWDMWRDALVRAGVPHVPLHGARASAASLLMDLGVPDRVIADILGHAQVATTMRHYLRSSKEGRAAALTGAADALGLPG